MTTRYSLLRFSRSSSSELFELLLLLFSYPVSSTGARQGGQGGSIISIPPVLATAPMQRGSQNK